MRNITINNFGELRSVLEDVTLMSPIYKHFVPDPVQYARVEYYNHPNGCIIKQLPGRYWVYVKLRTTSGMEYDAALWKILLVSTRYPQILRRLLQHIKVA